MSGFLGAAVGALTALGGGDPFGALAPPITIGGIPLTDFQVPRRVALGGEQDLQISRIPGGQLAIQSLGDFPDDIELEGIFQGPGREAAAAQFVQMRQAGVPVPLIALGHSCTVVIKRFAQAYETGWITYRMTLVVLPDPPAPQDQSGADALQAAVGDDAGSAQDSLSSAAAAVGNSAVTDTTLQNAGLPGLATAQDGAAAAGASAALDVSNLGAAASAGLAGNAEAIGAVGLAGTAEGDLATAQTALEGGIGQANALFAGGWSGAVPIAAQAGPALLYATGAAAGLAGTMAAAGFVGRAAANLANAAPNAAALPPPGAPGQVMTLP